MNDKDRELLLALVRKILKWLPGERPSAQDLFEDEFINQFMTGNDSISSLIQQCIDEGSTDH